jgi:hypothetical protein
MGIPPVIIALAKKRAKFVAELNHPQGRHAYCEQVIAAIDMVMPLWEAGKNPPVYIRQHKAKPTIVRKLVLRIVDALREGGTLTTAQIVNAVSAGTDDHCRRLELTRIVGWRLRDMRKEGRVTSAKRADRRNDWALAPVNELRDMEPSGAAN